jgi:ABC-type uncharacterized transport system permease subunit
VDVFEAICIEGLIYALMTLGVFITFRILDFADLTVDGTFPLGGAITALCLLNGVNPALTLAFAFFSGLSWRRYHRPDTQLPQSAGPPRRHPHHDDAVFD